MFGFIPDLYTPAYQLEGDEEAVIDYTPVR